MAGDLAIALLRMHVAHIDAAARHATACSHFLKDLINHADHGALFASRRPKEIALEILDWIDHPDRKSFCGQSVTAPLEAQHVARSYLDLFDSLVENHEPHSR